MKKIDKIWLVIFLIVLALFIKTTAMLSTGFLFLAFMAGMFFIEDDVEEKEKEPEYNI